MGRHLLLQFSDIHLLPGPHLRQFSDPLANLDRAIELITASAIHPEVILLTGDLADTGDALAYRLLRGRVEALTAATGAIAVFVPGNHDERVAFREHLVPLSPIGGPSTGPVDQVHAFGGLRVISMDSTVPGDDAGALSRAQLEWLTDELATPAPDGTMLALHHPPIGSPIEPMARLALADPESLQTVVQGSDVRLIVAGHYHHAGSGMLGGVPVWVSPALSYRSDTLSEAKFVGLTGSAFTRIDMIDGRPLVTVVPVPLV
jgi:3',5'-cyclic AMP phosphodiesterase CpdA